MIRYRCPACNATHEAGDDAAGTKEPCANCGQFMQVPRLAKAAPPTAIVVPAIRKEEKKTGIQMGHRDEGCLLALGCFGLIFGLLLTLFYWDRNTGNDLAAINNRTVGVLIGLGWTIAGVLLVGLIRRQERE